MKLILLFTLFSTYTFAQTIDFPTDSTNRVIYSEVVKTKGLQNELYLKGKEWFAFTFKSANDVIQMDDKQSGKIIGKGFSRGSYSLMLTPVQIDVYYTVSITCKDDRYKYEISNIYTETGTEKYKLSIEESLDWVKKGKMGSNNIKKKILPIIKEKIEILIQELKKAMDKPITKDDF